MPAAMLAMSCALDESALDGGRCCGLRRCSHVRSLSRRLVGCDLVGVVLVEPGEGGFLQVFTEAGIVLDVLLRGDVEIMVCGHCVILSGSLCMGKWTRAADPLGSAAVREIDGPRSTGARLLLGRALLLDGLSN